MEMDEIPQPHNNSSEQNQLEDGVAQYGGSDRDAWAPWPGLAEQKLLGAPEYNPPRLNVEALIGMKALLSRCTKSAAWKKARALCHGCEIDHPSQLQHSCVFAFDDNIYGLYTNDIYQMVFRPTLAYALSRLVWLITSVKFPHEKLLGAAEIIMADLCQWSTSIPWKCDEMDPPYATHEQYVKEAFQTWCGPPQPIHLRTVPLSEIRS